MEAIRETWAFDEGLFFTDDEELEEDAPPEPAGMDQLPEPVRSLLSALEEV